MPQPRHRQRMKILKGALQPLRPIRIADIGARATKTAPPYQPLLYHDMAEVYGFEPEPQAFAALAASAGPNEHYIQATIGAPGPATFYAHHIGSISSIFKLSAAAAKFLGKQFWVNRPITEMPVTLRALDQIDEVPPLDILKMDVQGAELDVMKGGRAKLASAVAVIAEVRFYRMYEGEPMWADFDAEMRAQGFELHRFQFQKSVLLPSSQRKKMHKRAGSQLLDGDAVYLPNLEDESALSDEQLMILAFAANSLFDSYDLCAMCLDRLKQRGAIAGNTARRYVQALPPNLLAEPEVEPVE